MSFSKMAYQDLVIYFVGRALSGTVGVTSIAKEAIVKDAVKTAQLAVQELADVGLFNSPNPVIKQQPFQVAVAAKAAVVRPYTPPTLTPMDGAPKQVIEIKPGVLMTSDGTVYRKEVTNGSETKESIKEPGTEGILNPRSGDENA